MKIFLIGTAYPYRGGLASYNERLMQEYTRMGHETKIYTFTLQYPSFLFPGKTQLSADPAPQDIEIEQTINSINPFNWWKVGRRISKEKPDIVICKFWLPFMGPAFGTIARFIKKNKHTKFITIIDNIIPHEKRIGDRLFAQYFANACDGFITMSKAVLEELKEFTQSKNTRFIPHPIYDNFGEIVPKQAARAWLKVGENDKILLFFGFVRKYKGLDILLEAMKDERIKQQNIKLIVAGEYYGDKAEYDAQILEGNLQNSVIQKPDFISNEEVKYYFSAADVVVQPYKTATQSGISQMAYHFEKPMIVTNVGGLPEIVPNNVCGYVTEVSVKAIADAIIAFYAEEKEVSFTAAVRNEKAKYAWNVMAEAILDLAASHKK